MAALGVGVHIHGCGRILQHLCARLLAGVGQSLLGVVHDELLAKGVDEVFRAPGDDELVGVARGEAHRVADDVSPQSARGGDHHGVVLAHFHILQRDDGRAVLSELVHRDELVEHAVVEHEHHRLVVGVVLQAEESLRGVVGLHVVHVGVADDLLILRAVGREGDSPVEEHLQVGPHLVDGLLARGLEHFHQHGQHPRRYARDVGHVLSRALGRNALPLELEVGEQRRLLLRHANEVGQRVDVLDEDGAEVAHERALDVVVGAVAASEYERAPVEESALGVVAQVEGHGVESTPIVYVVQSVV